MPSRTPIVAGNWKLNLTVGEALALVKALRAEADGLEGVEVVVGPVATALHPVAGALEGSSIGLAAQNTHWEDRGAFTGELSPELLKDVGCTHVIVGHSERRQLFGETDEGVNRKVRAVLAKGLTPILCVGETLAQREAGETLEVVLGQVEAGLEGVEDASAVVLAYEPVWAIGTGKTAKPEDAQEVHAAIRGKLGQVAPRVRILYGGSVKPANAAELLAQEDIDGALVGGASLRADTFVPIIRAALPGG
ncbi:MAG TPA: triose-phosphate isomerase [Polyangiaceae bacterium LLY-WYZ-15_(1-7)]|nr:triose-phosphate isomerase [Myxococcales bacterium]MAT24758.1 triose-phosphate isomerase [Sandaracinus sp.]HJK93974.1 triose-phosphate isomerase [Polyangiaceae bacterium LLY-WYZ-15_(1-7)]MBJ72841.1 triose-phosphate isomerase [Sandaracinus sp.]HJL00033.1 triose-phosphate isomerase [Polyangiaceae bacterium LLY-WYZ-15_(1-7)]